MEPTPCHPGISPETTERLFAVLNRQPAETECRFEGVQTDRSTFTARWSRAGTMLPPLSVVPQECAPDSARRTGQFVVTVPPELAQGCPSIVTLIAPLESQVAQEAPAGRVGSVNDPLFRGARALFAGIVLVTSALLLRGLSRARSADARWLALGGVGFLVALAVRALLPFSLGNWYSEVMPASGPPPWMRFGPGAFALQSLLRDAGIWNAGTLMLAQVVIGAAAVPLLLGVLRAIGIPFAMATATLVLLILDPLHARLSATTSEHVLASTLCMGLLLAWLRAARSGDLLSFAAALLLYPAVCATRIDMSVQATLALLWPFLRDRGEGGASAGHGARRWMIVVLALVAAATLFAAYRFIALPSQHPIPGWTGYRFALHYFVPQFWWLATTDPRWVPLSSVLLAMVGALALALQRPLLLVRVAGTLVLAFVLSGRTLMHDELVGARYFLFTIPIFLIASGYGFGTLLAFTPRRVRPLAATAAIIVLALWTGVGARSAYAARYAFQDEYAFAREALAALPAGCTIYQVQIRDELLPGDVDCCLDLARSPLPLDFPALRFRDLPQNDETVSSESSCLAYYESVACEITPGPPDRSAYAFAFTAATHFQKRCTDVRRRGQFELLAETTTSPRTTRGLFDDRLPHARLYRWMP